jgi:hypothetical protein
MPIERYACLALSVALIFGVLFASPAAPWAHFAVYSAITALLLAGTAYSSPIFVVASLIAFCALVESAPIADALDFLAGFAGIVVTAGLSLSKVSPCAESSAP